MEQMNLYPPVTSKLKTPSSKWQLLVVDDEIGMGESLRLLLSHLGYEVTIADSGEKALEELRSKSFDLVITDLVMEGVNGYDILAYVGRQEINIPVIMLTGLDSVDAAVRALKQGAYDFILKPFDFENFKASIHRGIEKRQLEMIQRIQKQRIDAVARISRAVSSTLKFDEIFQIIVQRTREFCQFDSAGLALLNKEREVVDLLTLGLSGEDLATSQHDISPNHPVFSSLLSLRIPQVIPDLSVHQEFSGLDFPLMEKARSCVLVPLVTKDRVVGALLFASRSMFAYTQQELDFLLPIADQIAVAVDNARLLELESRRARQLEVLHHIGKQLTAALVVEKLLEKAIFLLRDHFHYKHIDIFYFDDSKTHLIRCKYPEDSSSSAKKPAFLKLNEGVVGKVARTGQTLLVHDVAQEQCYREAFSDTWAELAVPLKTEEGVFGVLNIEDTALRRLTDDDRVVLEAVASQISLAWKNAKLFKQIRESKVYLELVLNAADDISIISIDLEGKVVTFNAGSEKLLGVSASEASGRPVDELVQNRAVRKILQNLGKKTMRDSWEDEVRVVRPDGKPFWAHLIVRPIEPEVDRFVGFLIVLTDITRRIELERELRHLTVTDDLTGLFNQRSFSRQIKREMKRTQRRNSPFSLCIFDLDKFKTYNDKHGHLAGDQILRRVGSLIRKTIRVGVDLAFRYGGDEFVLLLPDTSLLEAVALVERLRKVIGAEFDNEVSISAGLAEYVIGTGQKAFIESVDQLMYSAKGEGGDQVKVASA